MVRDESTLQQAIFTRFNRAREEVARTERTLLGKLEEIDGYAVELEIAQGLERDRCGPLFRCIQRVKVETVQQLGVQQLDGEAPPWELAGLDCVIQITCCMAEVHALDLGRLFHGQVAHALFGEPPELAVRHFATAHQLVRVNAVTFDEPVGFRDTQVGIDVREHVRGHPT